MSEEPKGSAHGCCKQHLTLAFGTVLLRRSQIYFIAFGVWRPETLWKSYTSVELSCDTKEERGNLWELIIGIKMYQQLQQGNWSRPLGHGSPDWTGHRMWTHCKVSVIAFGLLASSCSRSHCWTQAVQVDGEAVWMLLTALESPWTWTIMGL